MSLGLQGLDWELHGDEEPLPLPGFMKNAVVKHVERRKKKVFHYVISGNPLAQPIGIEYDKPEITTEERRLIEALLQDEISRNLDDDLKYDVNTVERNVALRLCGLDPRDEKGVEKYLEKPENVDIAEFYLAATRLVLAENSGIDPNKMYTFANSKHKRRKKRALAAAGIIVSIALSYVAYNELIKKPYKQAGGTNEQVEEFLSKYPWARNANQSTVEFFINWKEDKALAEETFKLTRSLNKTLTYIQDMKLLENWNEVISGLQKDENYFNFVHRFSKLQEGWKKELNESSVLKDWISDKKISFSELKMIQDLDLDNIPNDFDKFPFNPLNDKELFKTTKYFVLKLADYNKDKNITIGENYGIENLKSAINAVETNPKIIEGLNKYGCDWLVLFLKDNKGDEKYWHAVNAFGQLAQVYFYEMNYSGITYTTIRPYGLGVNKKYDEMEKSLVNERWLQLKNWTEKGEILIPIDGLEKSPWNDESKYIKNLKGMILPFSLFWQKIDNPNEELPKEPAFFIGNAYGLGPNTTRAIEMAIRNVKLLPEYHDYIWGRLKNSKTIEEDINSLKSDFACYKDWPTFMEAFPEILNLFTKEGTFYDKALVAVDGISRREILKYPDIEPQEFHCSNLLSSVGGAAYNFNIKYPTGPLTGHWHSTVGYPVSDYLSGKLYEFTKYGKVLIHKDTNAVCFWLFEDTLGDQKYIDIQYPFSVEVILNK